MKQFTKTQLKMRIEILKLVLKYIEQGTNDALCFALNRAYSNPPNLYWSGIREWQDECTAIKRRITEALQHNGMQCSYVSDWLNRVHTKFAASKSGATVYLSESYDTKFMKRYRIAWVKHMIQGYKKLLEQA